MSLYESFCNNQYILLVTILSRSNALRQGLASFRKLYVASGVQKLVSMKGSTKSLPGQDQAVPASYYSDRSAGWSLKLEKFEKVFMAFSFSRQLLYIPRMLWKLNRSPRPGNFSPNFKRAQSANGSIHL